jgi:uncharacterized protein with HEPN domain
MYSDKNLLYSLSILEAIEKVFLYSEAYERAEIFWEANDQMNFNACLTLLIAVGEDSKKLEESLKSAHSEIPWHRIAAFRNRLAHDYRGVDPVITFDIIRQYLPELKKVMLKMLKSINYDPKTLEKALASGYYKHIGYLKN